MDLDLEIACKTAIGDLVRLKLLFADLEIVLQLDHFILQLKRLPLLILKHGSLVVQLIRCDLQLFLELKYPHLVVLLPFLLSPEFFLGFIEVGVGNGQIHPVSFIAALNFFQFFNQKVVFFL